jgi:hypothetical protein
MEKQEVGGCLRTIEARQGGKSVVQEFFWITGGYSQRIF